MSHPWAARLRLTFQVKPRKQWLLRQSKTVPLTYANCRQSGLWIRVVHTTYCRKRPPLLMLHRFYKDTALSFSIPQEDHLLDALYYPSSFPSLATLGVLLSSRARRQCYRLVLA